MILFSCVRRLTSVVAIGGLNAETALDRAAVASTIDAAIEKPISIKAGPAQIAGHLPAFIRLDRLLSGPWRACDSMNPLPTSFEHERR